MYAKNGRVTIKDIAREADVSVATVSRVINKNYFVSEDITQRVSKAIEELGYISNSIARSLKINTTNTVGFVVSNISNPYHTSMAQAVENEIKKQNYNMIVCSTVNSKEREISHLKLLMSKNVDGLILNPTCENVDFVMEMSKVIPIVLINRRIPHNEFLGDLVDSNNRKGGYILAKQLLRLGHRKIFVLQGPQTMSNANERFAGVLDAMKEFGLKVDDEYPQRLVCHFSEADGEKACEYLSSMERRPTAVISLSNMVSIGFLRALRKKRIMMPEDISFVGFDNLDNWDLLEYRPTLVKYDTVSMGSQAGKAIIERIQNRMLPNREFIFEPTMLHGNTLGLPQE